MMKLMMVASALSLVACGAGEPWDGGWGEPPPQAGGVAGAGGSIVLPPIGSGGIGGLAGAGGTGHVTEGGYGGVTAGAGGEEPVGGESSEGGVAGEGGHAGTATGGYAGTWTGGAAGEPSGGYAGTATGGTGPVGGEGGASQAGSAGTGTGGGGSYLSCLANVSHCFDAAANCFEYSPGSDCDQIVDVCAAMQADCEDAP